MYMINMINKLCNIIDAYMMSTLYVFKYYDMDIIITK